MEVKHYHFTIFKPYGFLSQFVNNDVSKNKKKLLGELYPFPKNTMAIGRLDEKSEGLLLLTTDGQMSELVRDKNIEKEYNVQLDGLITCEAIQKLINGVEIGLLAGKEGFEGKRYTTKPCKVKALEIPPNFPSRSKKIRDARHGPTSWISITLSEGKFRQVRKMTAAVGFPTLRLVRIRVGNIHLSTMQPGDVIKVESFNIK